MKTSQWRRKSKLQKVVFRLGLSALAREVGATSLLSSTPLLSARDRISATGMLLVGVVGAGPAVLVLLSVSRSTFSDTDNNSPSCCSQWVCSMALPTKSIPELYKHVTEHKLSLNQFINLAWTEPTPVEATPTENTEVATEITPESAEVVAPQDSAQVE